MFAVIIGRIERRPADLRPADFILWKGKLVTEAEWRAATDPEAMFEFLGPKASERKLRLFGAACCRRVWKFLQSSRSRAVVEVLEKVADGLTPDADLEYAGRGALGFAQSEGRLLREAGCSAAFTAAAVLKKYPGELAVYVASRVADCARNTFYWVAHEGIEDSGGRREEAEIAGPPAEKTEGAEQARLLRDIFSGPFRVPAIDPAWLAWHGGTVGRLAATAYDERELPSGHLPVARLALLADALEDSGCAEAELLGHLRGSGPHWRGCWVVDLLLTKV